MMLSGARDGAMTGVRRLVATAMARDLTAFVLPGPAVARSMGLDLANSHLRIVGTPRHAGVLIVVGPLAPGLRDAAAVAYAQMPRPRAILALGAGDIAPLPDADAVAPLTQAGVHSGLADLRRIIATGAFRTDVGDFTASALEVRVEYTCPMHPEVVSDEPGNCPKCGMTLVPRETAAGDHTGHQMAESAPVLSSHSMPAAADATSDHTTHGEKTGQYSCPMHPEVVSDEPGSCPKCGMFLVKTGDEAGHGHDHGGHKGHGAHSDHRGHSGHPAHSDDAVHQGIEEGHAGHAADAADDATYTCPMHPEVISDEPGSCPKCGMFLVKAGDEGGHGHNHNGHKGHGAHSDHTGHASHGDHAKHSIKDSQEGHSDHAAETDDVAQYTCPMHPEVVSDEPGSCPKCGMFLVKVGDEGGHGHGHDHGVDDRQDAHAGHDDHSGHGSNHAHAGHAGHGGHSPVDMDGIEPHFMSMAGLTKDQPRSSDGLQMDWIEVPFGPFFPGLPAGLRLTLTLDGDTVAGSDATSLVGAVDLLDGAAMAPTDFADRLAAMMPLTPVAYRALACAAIEDVAGIEPPADQRHSRAAAVERERIASHLGWLAEFGAQSGFAWLATRAGALQLAVQSADVARIAALATPIARLIRRVQGAPLLRMRLGGIAHVAKDSPASGPVDRARGGGSDARSGDATMTALGFEMRGQEGGDALARLRLRCDEIAQSIELIAAAGVIAEPSLADIGTAAGAGMATVETPRGAARLHVKLVKGQVVDARLDTPSTRHLALIDALTAQQELGDALVAVGSLDLSAWEIRG